MAHAVIRLKILLMRTRCFALLALSDIIEDCSVLQVWKSPIKYARINRFCKRRSFRGYCIVYFI